MTETKEARKAHTIDDKKTTEVQVFKAGTALGSASNLARVLEMEGVLGSMDQAWPGELEPNQRRNKSLQLLKQAAITIETSPAKDKLQKCLATSVIDSLVAAAGMDISLNKALGEAYLVPYQFACTLQVGYRGFIKLIVNTGFVTHVESVVVYEGEAFEFHRDENGPHWQHTPDVRLQGQDDKIVGCYAVGYTRGAAPIFEFMNADELKKVQGASAAAKKGKSPYDFWATEMRRKAPIRRMAKYIPKTADNLGFQVLTTAVEHDNREFNMEGYAQEAEQFHKGIADQKRKDWNQRTGAEPAPQDQAQQPDEDQPDPSQ